MNKIEEFYKEAGGVEYDEFDKKANKFTYYDMIGFADAYHSKQLTLTDVVSSACSDYQEGINMQCAKCDHPKYEHTF